MFGIAFSAGQADPLPERFSVIFSRDLWNFSLAQDVCLCKVPSLEPASSHQVQMCCKRILLLWELDMMHLLTVCSDESTHSLTKVCVLAVVGQHSAPEQRSLTIQKCLCKVILCCLAADYRDFIIIQRLEIPCYGHWYAPAGLTLPISAAVVCLAECDS